MIMLDLKRGATLLFLLVSILSIIAPIVSAKQGHIKLLAVSETEHGLKGTSADLYLEVKPGSGRVFLDTFPFTKFDTQMSTRFAKEVACKFVDADCSVYDFFYTIRADTAIVGGPSAGAAVAVLTSAMVDDQEIDDSIGITGTINSGGIIGPVGGVKEKVEYAAKQGIKKIIIPRSSLEIDDNDSENNSSIESNSSLNLKQYASTLDIELIDVSDLGDALFIFSGKQYKKNGRDLVVNKEYKELMKGLADKLCTNSNELIFKYALRNKTDPSTDSLFENAKNLAAKGAEIYKLEEYYSAASYCFGAGAQLQYLMLDSYNLSEKEVLQIIDKTYAKIMLFDNEMQKKGYSTITGLETFAVVRERLIQADEHLKKSREFLNKKERKDSIYNLAFAIERMKSAELWSRFYELKSKEFKLNKNAVKQSCLNKLSEADERIKYVDLFFPSSLDETKKELTRAYDDLEKERYELCLFKASNAKAEANIVLNVFGVDNSKVKDIVKQKQDIVKGI